MSKNGIIRSLQVGKLKVESYESTEAMGKAAAESAAQSLHALAAQNDVVGVIFATGASQMATLEALTSIPGLPWEKVVGFHMDEYLGIPDDHPASFRRYLRERLTSKVKMRQFYGVDGTRVIPKRPAGNTPICCGSTIRNCACWGSAKTDTWRLTTRPRRTLKIPSISRLFRSTRIAGSSR